MAAHHYEAAERVFKDCEIDGCYPTAVAAECGWMYPSRYSSQVPKVDAQHTGEWDDADWGQNVIPATLTPLPWVRAELGLNLERLR